VLLVGGSSQFSGVAARGGILRHARGSSLTNLAMRAREIQMRRSRGLYLGKSLLMLMVTSSSAGCASGTHARRERVDLVTWDKVCEGKPSACESLRDFCELHPEKCFGPMPTREDDSTSAQSGPPPNLSRCLDACAAGSAALRNFCRSIRDPQLKAGCWGLEFVGETACRGWCFWHYGKR
jgi:hypothetical protein